MAGAFDRFRVIDADTRVFEPKDLWTSRVSKKWGELPEPTLLAILRDNAARVDHVS